MKIEAGDWVKYDLGLYGVKACPVAFVVDNGNTVVFKGGGFVQKERILAVLDVTERPRPLDIKTTDEALAWVRKNEAYVTIQRNGQVEVYDAGIGTFKGSTILQAVRRAAGLES